MAMPRSGGSASLTSTPSIRMRPELIGSSPAMMRSRVDLPQPDGPTSTQNSPSGDGQRQLRDHRMARRKPLVTLSIESVAMGQPFTAPASSPRTKARCTRM